MSAVLLERHDGWAEVVLNRPERKNAIEGTLADDFVEVMRAANSDASIRALVLRGAGGAFCSGLDLKAFAEQPEPAWKAGFAARWLEAHEELMVSRKAIIVALERYAINGGAALAIAGDLTICGKGAFLQVGEIQIGMGAPRNIAWLALRHSEATMARVCLLGDRIGADDLFRLGLVTEVVDDNQVLDRARACAQRLATFPAQAVESIKSGLRAASAQMPPRDWFSACTAADPMAGAARSIAGVKRQPS